MTVGCKYIEASVTAPNVTSISLSAAAAGAVGEEAAGRYVDPAQLSAEERSTSGAGRSGGQSGPDARAPAARHRTLLRTPARQERRQEDAVAAALRHRDG